MLNHVLIQGRLTADPKFWRTEKNDIPVCRFSIATQRPKYKGKEGETDFFNIVAWSKKAEIIKEWFKKGDGITIAGKLRTHHYEDKDGNSRTSTEIEVTEVHFSMGYNKNDDSNSAENLGINEIDYEDFAGIDPDDIPFQ